MNKKQRNINLGAAILFLIFSLLFFVLLSPFLSLFRRLEKLKARHLQQRRSNITQIQRRLMQSVVRIYDRNGEVIAEDRSSYSLIAILDEKMTTDPKKPNHVVDLEKTASQLAKQIDLKNQRFMRILKDR